MEAVARAPARLFRGDALRTDLGAIGAWLLPVVLIVYLALNNGGYDTIERSEVGIAVWWIVAVGTAVGILPVAGGTRTGKVLLALLAAFAGWTALSLGWTESAERTAVELGRTATYLGVFALALAVQGRGRWRYLLHGAATGVAVVIGLAVLSRFQPTWFPERITGDYPEGLRGVQSQLAYPLNYSTGLAGLAAIGLPLLLGVTGAARTALGSALAAAALPLLGLALWLTESSLALPTAVAGVGVFVALAPDRLPKLASLLVGAGGAAILIAAVEQRDALDQGLSTASARSQGDEALAITVVVCGGVALVQAGISLASRYAERPRWLIVPRRTAMRVAALGLAVAVVAGLAAGAPAEFSERWDDFRRQGEEVAARPENQAIDPSASGRYKYWDSAVEANATDPWLGIGPGTFEFWWARESQPEQQGSFVRDAHSFLLETLAELGIIGLLLVGGFAVTVVGIGVVRTVRAPPQLRLVLAAATAGCAAFTVVASVDWAWELATLPVVYLVLAVIVVAGGTSERNRESTAIPFLARLPSVLRGYAGRIALVALAVAAVVTIAIPLAGTVALENSRSDAAAGNLEAALGDARTAAGLQPYAAAPRLQEALLYERMGDLDSAVRAAKAATEREATNWRPWLILSRLEARSGNSDASLEAYRQAQSRNPGGLPK
jgi:hypothetical protein